MRVLFHYTHKQTLGHTTRSVSLCNALLHHKADLLILQGGVPQPFIHFPKGARVLDIPSPFDDRRSFQTLPAAVSAAQRAQFILKVAEEFKPDVFVTEFFPFGRMAYMSELLPTLRALRKKGARIIASIGYPFLAELNRLEDQKQMDLQQALFTFYDKFLIHTPKNFENPYIKKCIPLPALAKLYTRVIKDLEKKIVYTGYVCPEKIMTGGDQLPTFKKSTNIIVVSRGGGAVYPKLITAAIDAQRQLDSTYQTIIACGPTTTEAEMKLFKSCIKSQDKNRIHLVSHLDNLDDYLSQCRVSVSLSGYNTSVQLMRHGTPSVIVPYRNTLAKVSTSDQVARAELLQKKFQSTILDYETLTEHSLFDAIKKQISQPRPKAAPLSWFKGADSAAQFIVEGTLG